MTAPPDPDVCVWPYDVRPGLSTDLTAPKLDFRSSPESGPKSDIGPCPKSAQKLTLLSLGDSGKLFGSRGGVGGTPVQLLLSCRFSYWHRHCLFSERIWMATGHTDRGSRCERQHFRTGAIASRIARFDCWVHFFDGAHAVRSAARTVSQ